MLTAKRAFGLNARSAPLLPKVPELAPLYDWGAAPRVGQVIMIAGRPGSQKSGFALFWVRQMGLPTLYMSGDMTPFEATSRLVGMETRLELEEIEERIDGAGLTLDLTAVKAPVIQNIDVLDITGSGDNVLVMSLTDVLQLGAANTFSMAGKMQLMIQGNAGDSVTLNDSNSTCSIPTSLRWARRLWRERPFQSTVN